MLVISKNNSKESPSEFLNLGIEYFLFEEDFMEKNIRCIPMIVRFKMDKTGIKLKLSEWNKFPAKERIDLALMPCSDAEDIYQYKYHLAGLIQKYTGRNATMMEIDQYPLWNDLCSIPVILTEKLKEFNWKLSLDAWSRLTDLQRFALLKLCRPKHENKNFPNAMREFGLVN